MILAGEDRPHCLEDGEARVVLGCDQLEVGARALLLVAHDLRDLGVLDLQRRPKVHGLSVIGSLVA